METVSKIRRWVLADGLSIREVSRRTGISRNTVRKYLREDIVAPRYRQSGSRPSRKLLDYEVRLRALYEADLHLKCPRADTPCIVAIAAKAGNHRQRAARACKTWCTEPSEMTGFAGYSVHHNFWQMAPKIRREDKALQGPWHQIFNLAICTKSPSSPQNDPRCDTEERPTIQSYY